MTTKDSGVNQSSMNVRRLVRIALLVALSVVGASIKIPSILGTPAFDSMPGYFAAAVLGRKEGALIAALGHIFTALTAGFPLSLPIHLLTAVEMGICAYVFGFLFRKTNSLIAIIVATVLNGVGAPTTMIPIMGMPVFYALITPLLIASGLNIVIAAVLAKIPGINLVVRGHENA
ncbi:MAG: ECF transporter S component [Clostridiales bacterium]